MGMICVAEEGFPAMTQRRQVRIAMVRCDGAVIASLGSKETGTLSKAAFRVQRNGWKRNATDDGVTAGAVQS